MLGRHRDDADNVRGTGNKGRGRRRGYVDKAQLVYVMGNAPGRGDAGGPPGKGPSLGGIIKVLAALGTVVSTFILTDQWVTSGQAGETVGPALSAVNNVVVAIGMAFGRLAHHATIVGPLVAAGAFLVAALVLRLIAERLGLFVTVSPSDALKAGAAGIPILLMEYTVSCLLFLPLAGLWLAAFYSALSRTELIVVGIAYIATMAVASLIAAATANRASHFSVILGQLLSVLAAIGTTSALTTQGLSSAVAPIHNPGVAALAALLSVIALRFLMELFAIRVTPRVTLMEVVYGWLILSPLAALWIGAFYSTVPMWAVVVFSLVYLATVAVATAHSRFILIMFR